MKNSYTYTIHGWMKNELNLKGNELILYAIIYGFSNGDRGSSFRGSITYIREWLDCSRTTVIQTKKSLVKKGLIIEIENPTGNEFKVVSEKYNSFTLGGGTKTALPVKNTTSDNVGGTKTVRGGVQKLYGGGYKNCTSGSTTTVPTSNNYNNKDNNSNKEKIKNFQEIRIKTLTDKWKKWQMYFANENQKELVLDWLTYLTYVGKSYTTAHPVMAIRSKLDKYGFEAVKKAMEKAKESEAKSFDWALEKTESNNDVPVFNRKGKK